MNFRFLLTAFVLCVTTTHAQIAIYDLKDHPRLRSGPLYVQLGDTLSPYAREVMDMFRMEWTVSPVRFIATGTPDEVFMVPGNYFLSADRTTKTMTTMRETHNHGTNTTTLSSGNTTTNDYFYLAIWTPKKDNTPKWDLEERKDVIVRSELFLSSITWAGEITFTDLGISTKSFGSDFLNGSKGRLRNVVQFINAKVAAGQEVALKKDQENTPDLERLKKETLFLVNYWYGPGTYQKEPMKPGSAEEKYFKKLTADYPHPHQWITLPELEQKLSAPTEDFFYLSYVQSSADKMVSVVNGRTGDIVYYEFVAKAYRPNKADFDRLKSAIEKL